MKGIVCASRKFKLQVSKTFFVWGIFCLQSQRFITLLQNSGMKTFENENADKDIDVMKKP